MVSTQLLSALQERFGDSSLEFSEPPKSISGGYETLVYGFSLNTDIDGLTGPLVLRIFKQAAFVDQARRETAVQNSLATLGYLVPRVAAQFDTGINGLPFNVMERVPGHPMMENAELNESSMKRMIDWWAAVHVQLHQLSAAPVIEALEAAGFTQDRFSVDGRVRYLDRYFEGDTFDALRPVHAWLSDNRPAERTDPSVCHGDFHPGNIMVDGDQVTGVIDWPGIAIADPEFDIGTTMVLIRAGAAMIEPEIRPMIEAMADMYVARYNELSPVDMDRVRYYEAMRSFRAFVRGTAAHIPGLAEELAPRDQYPWAAEFTMNDLAGRLRQLTGIELPLPGGG